MPMKHYGDKDGLLALSYNGIITAVNSNRNYGKTWTFKKRAFKRALKHGKKTIWLRMFKKELQEVADTFYKSRDLQNYCGVRLYDKDHCPNGNVKRDGYTFYYRKNNKSPWNWFIKIFALSNPDAVRSADDVDVDTIVFDEYTKTAEKYKRYRGNMVNDFIDIWVSAKREHEVRCILLGNKEGYGNPFFTYFHITPPPETWEGIRVYRKGAFVLQQINNLPNEEGDFNRKTAALLEGTSYGDYIYKSRYKAASGLKPRKTPASASLYVQLLFKSTALKISIFNGFFYVNRRIEEGKQIYCDALPHKYKKERMLVRRLKPFFSDFVTAISDNRVFYDDELTHEAIQPFLQWLGI